MVVHPVGVAGSSIRAGARSRAVGTGAARAGAGGRLAERTDELAVVDAALQAAVAGWGAIVLVEGAPGIGKTALLTAAWARAGRQGMLALSARGEELERSFAFGVVRQLFEPAVTGADGATRDGLLCGAALHARTVVDPRAQPVSAVDRSAVLHGLYWLTANLAADRPLVLVVDDLHWSDPASIDWLAYLARRIAALPVALLLGARAGEPGADGELLQRLRATDGLRRLQPAPLSAAAVGGLARGALGEHVDHAFATACHEVTRGNPFYVVELLRALREDRVAGTAANVSAIDGLTPRVVVDATLARLGRLPSEARSVAEAVALLEPGAELRWIAGLTGLDVDRVAGAADALLTLGLLRGVTPCGFQHPILRSAVEGEIAPARRGRLHHKAARMLAAAGLPVEAVAAHLLRAPPVGESWVASTLAQAAARAKARGAPGGAVPYLERALAERPARRERRELLLALGRAESWTQAAPAATHLREALALADGPEQAAVAGLALGHALFGSGAIDDAYAIVSDVVGRTDEHAGQAVFELQAFLIAIAGPAGRMAETGARADALAARADESPAAGSLHASLALRALAAGRRRELVREHAQRALAVRDAGFAALGRAAPGMALLWIDDLDRAEQLFSEAIEDASRMGRIRALENYCALRGYAARRRGDLAGAAADVEPVLAAAAQGATPGVATLVALVTQVLLLVDQGRPQDAGALAALAPIPAAFERLPIAALLRHAQAVAERAQRRFGAAAATLAAVGEVCERSAIRSPAVIPWRSDLALALAGSDRHDEGVELARAELRLAEHCDVDRARGCALRALGLLEGGQGGLRRLAAAVEALERSPARLELGWAQYELGAALRRANERRDARAPLDRALDIALSCGATRLADRAREELKALGAKRRDVMLTGPASLTVSERRVCRLASQGMRNSEIAQALFVSTRTVETHLHHAYRKLDIVSREELAPTLAAAAAG